MEEKHSNGMEAFLKKYIEKTDRRMVENEERMAKFEERMVKNDERWAKNDERWAKNDERWAKNEERWAKNEERWARNEEHFNTYLKHNEREKDRIWKTLSEHGRRFTHLECRIDRSLDEIKRMRLEFQRWVREQ